MRLIAVAAFAALLATPASGARCGSKWLPPALIASCPEGTVTLGFVIKKDGTVTDISVRESSGNTALDEATKACATQWHYRPALKNGEPIEVHWATRIRWASKECHPLY
jgi:protein TonB